MSIEITASIDGTSKEIYQGEIRPDNGPSIWIDHTEHGRIVLAAICLEDDSEGRIYRIPEEELPEGTDLTHIPDELYNDDTQVATIGPQADSREYSTHVAKDTGHGAEITLRHR